MKYSYSYSVYAINDAFKGASSLGPKPAITATNHSNTMQQSIINIRKCSSRVLALMLLWVAFLAVTAVRYPKMRTTVIPRGQVQEFVVFTDLGYLIMISSIAVTVNYLHKPSKVSNSSDDSKGTAQENVARTNKVVGTITPIVISNSSSVEREFPKQSTNDA